VTPTGIETVDGQCQDLDVLVCATGNHPATFHLHTVDVHSIGFDSSFQWPFVIIGRDGIDIRDKFKPYPKTYLGACVDGFPNLFIVGGPNVGTSFIPFLDRQAIYATQAILKLQRERLQSIEISRTAVDDFDEYLEVRHVSTRPNNS
jgi:cation diffusion facilitator CzcD-associated flavoprotein CzcO